MLSHILQTISLASACLLAIRKIVHPLCMSLYLAHSKQDVAVLTFMSPNIETSGFVSCDYIKPNMCLLNLWHLIFYLRLNLSFFECAVLFLSPFASLQKEDVMHSHDSALYAAGCLSELRGSHTSQLAK